MPIKDFLTQVFYVLLCGDISRRCWCLILGH